MKVIDISPLVMKDIQIVAYRRAIQTKINFHMEYGQRWIDELDRVENEMVKRGLIKEGAPEGEPAPAGDSSEPSAD